MRIFLLIKPTIFFIIVFLFNISYGSEQKSIVINGNENIDDEVIYSILTNISDDYSEEDLNTIIKSLYETGNFKSVQIEQNNKEIIINVVENPKIRKINFVGNKRFKRDVILQEYDRDQYFRNFNLVRINQFIEGMKSLYQSFGYNTAEIKYSVSEVENENEDIVDINFTFIEGDISKINYIYFIGNADYDNRDLLSQIKSKPKNFLRFFSNTNFKKYEINNDLNRLISFYINEGYREANINYKIEFIELKNRFNIYFYINEGKKYNFGNIDSSFNYSGMSESITSNIESQIENFKNKKVQKNNTYNNDLLEILRSEIADYLFNEGLIFFDIDIIEEIVDLDINVVFDIKSIEPKFVNQVNIYGNTRTLDKVIRREIEVSEGDAINTDLIRQSARNLNKLGIFKSVIIDEVKSSGDTVDLEVNIQEKSTGDFQVGVAFDSLNGAAFISGLREKNIAGLGRQVDVSVNTSDKNTKYNFGIVEPYVFNRKIDFIYGISYQESDYTKSASYDLTTFNTKTGFQYVLSQDLSHAITIEYSLKDYVITDSSTVDDNISKRAGNNAEFLLNNFISLNKLDSFIRPTKGTYISYRNLISPSTNSDNGYIKNVVTYKKYYKFNSNIFSIQTKAGNIFSIQNKEIATDNKFSLGGRWLRGFDSYGAGPRKSRTSYTGGNNLLVAKFDLQRPLIKNSDNPIDLNLFLDVGTVFDNKNPPTNSKESVRSSYGVGFKFYSPIGPVGFSWAFPISSESYDIERMFLFSIGNLN